MEVYKELLNDVRDAANDFQSNGDHIGMEALSAGIEIVFERYQDWPTIRLLEAALAGGAMNVPYDESMGGSTLDNVVLQSLRFTICEDLELEFDIDSQLENLKALLAFSTSEVENCPLNTGDDMVTFLNLLHQQNQLVREIKKLAVWKLDG